MKRETRARIASETLDVLSTGSYALPNGAKVDIAPLLRKSVNGTILITPEKWGAMIDAHCKSPAANLAKITVTGETSLAAAYRLSVVEKCKSLAVLNFASAKNPGGGFLSGSQAQEESLARSSGLFTTINGQQGYYLANRKCGNLIYTDHAIFSPDVPVFRDDEGTLLPAAYTASFITMPAVNASKTKIDSLEYAKLIEVMSFRVKCVLALAIEQKQRNLILGAWGCGVFKNDPAAIAGCFASALSSSAGFRNQFDQIIFAIPDAKMCAVFAEVLKPIMQ